MATANAQLIAALIGPVHGIAWLFGVITTWRDPRRTNGIAVLAAIPGIGGMLALRALGRAEQGVQNCCVQHRATSPATRPIGGYARPGHNES
jgi:hypothetical protein